MNLYFVALALSIISVHASAGQSCGWDKTGDEPVWRCKKVVTVHGGTKGNSKHDVDAMVAKPTVDNQSKALDAKAAQKSVGQ
ncbi:hypothetical protein [Caballeronia novacaledonica]|uniref:Uncharacterized protein n=1 Tax=Caballeronia novacaledonica TaxID=1544861 RepID=A0AA37IAU8_9BURK|nr:hypothetical protein [Caballeronia novacaledonica]GJH26282.1 hypothetical protein CBA19CS42_17220 [Caballeronia novacaledonica]